MKREVRVRFAPSPTGALHIGGVRTALYNYLFAKKMGGKMLLRIEDTDQTRFVKGAEDYIRESLEWVGIKLDESPWNPGECGPYRQSERKPMYMDYAMKMLQEGNAYYAFDTTEELTEMRDRLKKANVPNPQYNSITRATMKNSLTLPADEVKARLESGEAYVIRIKIPRKEEVRFNDMIRGWVLVHSSAMDDKVLMKSDGMPTYHLANIVDDHLMKITHVIRGEEWLPSAPLHVLLYRYLGWEDTMPEFAHLPLILKPDGNGKLSKRDGDLFGFPVFPLEWNQPETNEYVKGFREEGYLPEAVVNFLALLGWNPGNNDEIFSMEQLIDIFSIEKIGKSGAKFDYLKAQWFNQHYLREQSDAALGILLKIQLSEKNIQINDSLATKIAGLMKERISFSKQLAEESAFFFERPTTYDQNVVSKKWNSEIKKLLLEFKTALANLSDYNAVSIKEILFALMTQYGKKPGDVMPILRVLITGAGAGPDLMQILEIIGKQECVERMNISANALPTND